MKKILVGLAAFVFALVVSVSSVSANEGRIRLSGSDVVCEGVSVWRRSNYRIVGRCQGLVYPFSTQMEYYTLWARMENGNEVRLSDIDRGFFEGNTDSRFESVFVTAEGSSSPRRPSSNVIVSGDVSSFDFSTAKSVAVEPTPAPAAETEEGTMTVQSNAGTATTTAGSVLTKILKSLLVIVGVIIVITVVASLIFRRRGSVSA